MKDLPKIELHCHLDGSLRTQTVIELALEHGVDLPSQEPGLLAEHLIAPLDCDSLVTYLKRFDLPIAIMQTADALERATYELLEDAADENVKYIEIRFAPQQHQNKGLSQKAIIEAVLKGMNKGMAAFDIRANLILSHLRHTSAKDMYETIDAGVGYLGQGVVAVDLCGAENEGFCSKFIEPVRYAQSLGYRVCIHAGETGFASNVIDAVTLLGADRIGHGVAIANDPEAYALVKDKSIVIESCPTSNVQTKAIDSFKNHPAHAFHTDDLALMLNTDNRTVSNTTMTHEYEVMAETFGWTQADFDKIYLRSVDAAYADEATKTWLRQLI